MGLIIFEQDNDPEMKKRLFYLTLLTAVFTAIFVFGVHAQSKQGNNWYFGNKASLDFNSGAPISGKNSGMIAYGGCTSVSDKNGKLLFYTNGATVYNANHDTMKNGTGLMTDWVWGNWGQSVIAVQRPEIPTYYYIFTVYRKNASGTGNYPESMRYCIVYTKDQNGLGSVNKRNSILELGTFETKLTTVNHRNGKDIWVIAKEEGTKKFYAYLITKYGVSVNPVISSVGNTNTSQWWYNGALKASADGKWVASTRSRVWNSTDSFVCDLYKFDDSSGTLTQYATLSLPKGSNTYWGWGNTGVEFSPDGSKMYLSDNEYNYSPPSYSFTYKLYQFELRDYYSAKDIQDSRLKVANVNNSTWSWYSGMMQLAPDGKIYISRWNSTKLGVINAPNQRGKGCCYDHEGATLSSGACFNGLPNIPSSWYKNEVFTWESDCYGDSIPFKIFNETCLDSVHWNFGDTSSGAENYSNLIRPKHYFTSSGHFDVTAITYRQGIGDSATLTIDVYPFPVPKIGLNDPEQCFNSNSFDFIDSSTIDFTDISYYYWDLGDSTTVTNKQKFNHSYSDTGKYTVRLIIASEYGCRDTIDRDIYIHPNPVADMQVSDTGMCFDGNLFHFTDSSSIVKGTYKNAWAVYAFQDSVWMLHDSFSYPADTFYSFTRADTFKVLAYAVSDKNCIDDTSFYFNIKPNPVADFSINDSIQCLSGNLFKFTNNSSLANDTLTYTWYFGDGDSSTTKNPTHSYASYDTFLVQLNVSASNSCVSTAFEKVYVRPNPKASFIVNDSVQCLNENVFTFIGTSTINYDTLSFYWTFGDSSSSYSTLSDPSHLYSYYDTFRVSLMVNTNYNCRDSFYMDVMVYPNPVADFTVNDSLQCLSGNEFTLTNLSSISQGSQHFKWDFGDGSTSNQSGTVKHRYKADGTYQAQLVAISDKNCRDSLDMSLTVAPMPAADFNINDFTQCFNQNQFTFTSKSLINSGTMNYYWTFGDGSIDSGSKVQYSYGSDDTFSVQLLSISDKQCKDSISKTVYVFPNPEVRFYTGDSIQCYNEHRFYFKNLTKINSGSINYIWSYGDGNLSMLKQPNYRYNYPDSFDVKLIGISGFGCKDSSKSTLIVHPSPETDFNIADSQQCLSNNSFNFSNLSSIQSGTLTYDWNFGDSSLSSLTNPAHSYVRDDTFEVQLLATSSEGCMDSIVSRAYVFPMPVAKFNINDTSQCFDKNNFIYYNKSFIHTGYMTYFWNFGDGGTSTNTSPSHSYTYVDTFNVKLIATSNLGCTDSTEKETRLFVQPMPVPYFMSPDTTQCQNTNAFTYKNLSSIPKGSMTYEWFFGDGDSSSTITGMHHFTKHDTFNIKLRAISNWGCIDSFSAKSIVYPLPEPEFTLSDTALCLSGNKFDFSDQSTILYGKIDHIMWLFGDGKSDTLLNASHSYTGFDTFTVSLVARSNFVCYDTIRKQVVVHPMPDANFNINDAEQCFKNNLFALTDTSSIAYGNINRHMWQWDDGQADTGAIANHSYQNFDTFKIKHLIYSEQNCPDSLTREVIVRPMPISSFDINDTEQCLYPNVFTFNANPSVAYGNISSYSWNFDDSATANSQQANHVYSYFDTFNVRLKVLSNYGCTDDSVRQVMVRPNPKAAFAINQKGQCLMQNKFDFNSNTTIAYGSYNEFWQFGDGDTTSGLQVSHIYSFDTTLIVKQLVRSNYGCLDSSTQQISIYPMPKAEFDYSGLCINESITFTDLSQINSPDSIVSWDWSFGNGSSQKQNPVHMYTTAGDKLIKLVAGSNHNCKDSILKKVHINERVQTPKMKFVSVNDNADGANSSIIISWEEMNVGVPKAYLVERSIDGTNYSHLTTVNRNTFEYEDFNVDVDKQSYYYRVNVVDSCDYLSPDGNENYGKSILLSIDDNKEYPELHWSLYKGWKQGIASQEVNVYENGYYNYQVIDILNGSDTFYRDYKTTVNVDQYCYQINALSQDNLVSESNIICVPTTLYIYAPNAFTPNGDALNPVFKAVGKNILEFEMHIYNRWGQQMFYTNDIHQGWDGTYQNTDCPAGVYTYIITARGTQYQMQRFSGSITLIR